MFVPMGWLSDLKAKEFDSHLGTDGAIDPLAAIGSIEQRLGELWFVIDGARDLVLHEEASVDRTAAVLKSALALVGMTAEPVRAVVEALNLADQRARRAA